ncbi:gamma-aminobutyric acid receptor subunit beta-like [Eriocheir sinensis]|uniref:gamma-aminobutyric acid receptor subunit beta-like n=1 Tax=Eriocheir sinensis TaxID=95602 RepID=UPI0021CACA52|nr:gamma-aminobutyric acid receptor subunit beta-like [Eriocheir sinensis]
MTGSTGRRGVTPCLVITTVSSLDGVYEGSGVRLSLTQRFLARVACYLELYWYPFDRQRCAVEVQLSPESGGGASVVFGASAEVRYTGPYTLAIYTVQHVGRAEAGQSSLRVDFELHRRQGVIMLSTFLPSGLLLLVSWATLFVGIKEMNVRCIMSLTTLLVLYTLFSNMSRSLPATASIKLIDVWFFFIIFLLFANIVVHICVRPAKSAVAAATTKVELFLPAEPQPAPPEPAAPRLLRTYRLLVLPLIVVLFNLIFWVAVLMQ